MCSERFFPSLLLLLLMPGMLAMSSCSIFEDRRACPCLLSLKMDDPSTNVSDSLFFMLGGDGFVDSFRVKSDVSVAERKIYYRGALRINALSDDASVNLVGGDLIIPLGEQCPEVYLYGVDCQIDAEEHTENIRLAKNYCGVSMTFVTNAPDEYIVKVLGNVCGYDSEGKLIPGDFEYSPKFQLSSESFFRVPRQNDSSLRLAISSKGASGAAEGAVHYFALGNYIEQSGYDWTKTDLDDIVLCIDFVTCIIALSINEWSQAFEIDVII